MRKIIVSEMISLDGFFAGLEGDISWHVVDEDFNQYAINLLQTVDTILFGRVTYDLFESYWPDAAKNSETSASDREIANLINNATKIVFSKTLEKVDWNNVQLQKEIIAEEIMKLKQQPGKDIVVYGSGTIVQRLTELKLIDEYRFFIAPVILGKGKLLLKDLEKRLTLQLFKNGKLSSGVVVVEYQPKN